MKNKWYEFLLAQGCMVADHNCGGGLQIHHLTHGGRPKDDMRTIPLCFAHHHWQSPLPCGDAYHKGTKAWERKHGSQEEMLLDLRAKYFEQHGKEIW